MLLVGTGASYAVLNLYYPERGITVTKAISGNSRLVQLASRIMNFDFLSAGWKLDDTARRIITLERFEHIGSLKGVAGEQLPGRGLSAVEKLSGIKSVYARGIWSAGETLGNLIVLYRTEAAAKEELDRLEMIGRCIQQIVPELIENEERSSAAGTGTKRKAEGDYLEAMAPRTVEEFRPDIFVGLDRDLTIVFANHAISQLGPDRESAVGSLFSDLLPPGEREAIAAMLLELSGLDGEASRSATLSFGPDLRLRMVAYRNSGENRERLSLILRDVSKELRLSAAFLQREEMLQQLADAMSEAVWIESIEPQKIIYINPRFAPLFRLESANAEEEIASLFAPAGSDLRDPRETRKPTQLERRLSGDPERWVRIRSYPILNPDTQPLLINIAEDITQERKALELLEKQYEGSRLLLHEMNHRIKNNLSIVAGLTGLAAGRSSDPDVQEEFELLENKISSIALVHEILFHGEDSDQLDFAYYAENLLKILSPATPQGRPIRIETELEAQHIPPAAAGVLGLIITELVTNASKHAFPESIDDPAIHVFFGALKHGGTDTLLLTVGDSGAPIDYDPLSADGKTLGMEILKTLAEQIDGRITFAQKEGRKVFSVYMPQTSSRN